MRLLLSTLFIALVGLFSVINAAPTLDSIITNNHLLTIRSHVQSHNDFLLSGIHDIQNHAEALTLFGGPSSSSLSINLPDNIPLSFPKQCLDPSSSLTAQRCQTILKNEYNLTITLPMTCRGFPAYNYYTYNTSCTVDLKSEIISQLSTNNQAATTTCIDAINSYSSAVNSTCSNIIELLTYDTNADGIDALINQQCAVMNTDLYRQCKTAIANTQSVVSACPNYNLGQIKYASAYFIYFIDNSLDILCTKDDGDSSKYCLSGLVSNYDAIQKQWSLNPTKTIADRIDDNLLNNMCRSCIMKVIDKLSAISGNMDGLFYNGPFQKLWYDVSTINILCTKDPTNTNHYCAKIFPAVESLTNYIEKGIIPTNNDFNKICSPCMNALFYTPGAINIFGSDYSQLQKTACLKDATDNNYCVSKMYNKLNILAPAFESCINNNIQQCSGACMVALTDLYQTDCCFASLGFTALTKTIMFNNDYSKYYPRFAAASACATPSFINNLQDKKQCTKSDLDEISFEIILSNIDYYALNYTVNNNGPSYVLSGLLNAIESDLSTILGIDSASITMGSFSLNNNNNNGVGYGSRFSFTVRITNNNDKWSYVNTFNNKLSNGIAMPVTFEYTVTTASNTGVRLLLVDSQPLRATGQGGTISGAMMNNNLSSITIIIMSIATVLFARF